MAQQSEATLNRLIRNGLQLYNEQKQKNAMLKNEIAALEEAYRYAQQAKDKADDAASQLLRGRASDTWKGGCKKLYERDRTGPIDTEVRGYVSAVGHFKYEVRRQVLTRQLSVNYFVESMASIENQINQAKNSLAKLENQR